MMTIKIIMMMIMDDYDFMMMMMMMIVMILMMMEHTSQSVGKLMKNAYASDYLLRIERRVFYTATVTLMTELLIQKRTP